MASRCKSRKADGSPCEAQPVRASGYCYWHDPELVDLRDQKNREGGANRSNARRARKAMAEHVLTAEEIRGHLGQVFLRVIEGETEPGVGVAAATIARALLDVARVAELEQQVAQMRSDMATFARRSG